jgi:fermentation-respiration switch protein FrsA (DUF1100 family)
VNLIVALAVSVVAMYLGLLLLIWRFQERVVFQPPKVASQSSARSRTVSFQTADGLDLFAHVVGEYLPGTTVLLAFHGNADIARWLIPWATDLARAANICVVLPEYRGYDGLLGAPSYDGAGHDANAALRYVRDTMGVPQQDLVYFGHSLGSAIAAELAVANPPRTLILQSPFSSANGMSRRYLLVAPSFLVTRISRVHFDTLARVRDLSRPVWVAHGTRDVIVPVRMGRAVFDAAKIKGELLVLPKAGHNDVGAIGGDVYSSWLRRAIDDQRKEIATPAAPAETRPAP